MNDYLRNEEEIIFRQDGTKYDDKDLQIVVHYLRTRQMVVMLNLVQVI